MILNDDSEEEDCNQGKDREEKRRDALSELEIKGSA